MDVEERIGIEKRMSHMERELATHGALLKRNSEILDDIRQFINAPKRTPEWIATGLGVLAAAGTLLYAAYIAPLEGRVLRIETEVQLLSKTVSIIDKDHSMNQQMFKETWQKLNNTKDP